MKAVQLTLCGVMLAAGGGFFYPYAQATPSLAIPLSAAEQQVLAFEKQRCDAVLHRDIAALSDMLTDDLTYVHASGIRQNKKEYLAYVAAGKVTYTSYQIDGAVVHILGDAAVTHGTLRYQIATTKPESHGAMLYTGVYARSNGKWKLTSWEATSKAE